MRGDRWQWSRTPKGERLDLCLSGPGRLVHGPGTAWCAEGLDRQPRDVHRQRTVGRCIRGLDQDTLIRLDWVLLPIL